jgi:uncharacterized protein (TIGR03663 family)
MAEATLPSGPRGATWLDRSILPSRERLAGLVAYRELLAYGALVVIGFVLRVWDVGSRAMHHDESLHAYYAWKFFVGQGYSYLPLMHGPLQFVLVPVFYLVFGDNETSARLLAVVLGTVMIALPYFLRSYLTRPGALLAALMITVSPSLVYYSRFIRDDIYLACFTLILFICIVRYLERHEARYVYIGAAAMALAMASMEAAYLNFFIFGSFLVLQIVRELWFRRSGADQTPVLAALRATSLDTWLTGISVFIVIVVLLFSTFFTNPSGIWDAHHALFHPGQTPFWATDRVDILGGVAYWLAQHDVQRGGQPWFYYLLVLPLYEQLAVVFGIAGIVVAAIRRSLITTFLVWWAVSSLVLYSWAGEKMPWLSIHITLPFILLAGLALGNVFRSRTRWLLPLTAAVFAAFFALEVHSTFALNYEDGANPTEMLIYVQTSQDVPNTISAISTLSHERFGGTSMPIGIDNSDVGGWPFQWYLRDYPNLFYTSSFATPACGTQWCPVLLMLGPEYDQYASTLDRHYVVQRYRWNWWFPEDYKTWFPDHVGTIPSALFGGGSLAAAPIGTAQDWHNLWNWLIYRQPFGTRGARMLYFLVRRDLVPGSRYYSTKPPSGSAVTVPAATVTSVPALAARLAGSYGTGGVTGPRGVAADAHGDLYVADPVAHRVVEIAPSGNVLRSWGSVGTGPGQFNKLDSPQDVAVGSDGNVYVADTWNQRIQVFSPTGRFLRQWGGGSIGSQPGQFYGPRSVAVGPSGNIYVADTGNERIQVFTSTGTPVTTWGTRGASPGQFTEPSSVAAGPNGRVYVADFWNQRIQVFTASGTFLRSWPVTDWTAHSYDEPYIAVSPTTGDIYASDPQQQRVLVWTPTGRLLGAVSSSLTLPLGVAITPHGALAVSDSTAARVDVFTLAAATHGRHTKP